MKLYDHDRYDSGNCYRVRLMLALLGLPFETVLVDVSKGQNRSAEFLRLNPRGQVPVLEDGGEIYWDSIAILLYLARKYGTETWLPLDARSLGRIGQWLALASDEIFSGLALARSVRLGRRQGNLQALQRTGMRALDVMEQHLTTRDWLACGCPTVADVACYPYVALASEAGVGLAAYPAVGAWLGRLASLPGYLPLPTGPVRPATAAPGHCARHRTAGSPSFPLQPLPSSNP